MFSFSFSFSVFGSLIIKQILTGGLFFLLFLFVIDFITNLKRNWNLKHFPPGPRTNIEFFWKFRHFLLLDSTKSLPSMTKYEKIIGISNSLLRSKAVIINDLTILKELFNNPAVTGRTPMEFGQMYEDGKYRGFAMNSGNEWRELRRFTVSQLKDLGMNSTSIQPMIEEEADHLVAVLQTKIHAPFCTKHFFDMFSFNTLWRIISGQRFSLDDPAAQGLVHCIEKVTYAWLDCMTLYNFPVMSKWLYRLPFLADKNPFPDFNGKFLKFTNSFVQDRINQPDYYLGKYGDFTDAFLEKIHSTTDVNSPFYGQLGYENLNETIRDLFFAGTDTTGNTMSWALLYLALHPEKQKKLQEEIDSVVEAEGRAPSLGEKHKMPYVEAVIHETLRRSSFAPVGIPHETTEDITLAKYKLSKGTVVVGNTYAIHHSEEIWGSDRYEFRPERFLTPDESTLVKFDGLVPFSLGRRLCPGMSLAKDDLFVFLTRIFLEFNIECNPNEPKPEMWSKIGMFFEPPPHTFIITPRKKLA